MGLFDERFDGWQASDFAAFEQRKWSSNRFNLERGRVRRRLIDLLAQVREAADHPAVLSPDPEAKRNGTAWVRRSSKSSSGASPSAIWCLASAGG